MGTCLFACTHSKNDNDQITIDLDGDVLNYILYSSFVDSIEYIPLETKEECLLGNLRDVMISDSLVLVLNSERTSIFIFNKKGKFVRQIKHIGDGPGEYVAINQFSYNKNRNRISIASNNLKIIEYDILGNFKKEFRTSCYITDLHLFDNGSYIISRIQRIDEPNDILLLMDSTGVITKSMLKRNPLYKIDGSALWDFTEFDNEIHFISPQLDNTLYSYCQDSLKKYLIIKISPEVPTDFYEDKPNVLGFGKHYYRTVYRESRDWLNLAFYSETKGLKIVIYNKRGNQYMLGSQFKNDIDKKKEGEFLSASNGNIFTGYIESEEFDKNPTIQILHLK